MTAIKHSRQRDAIRDNLRSRFDHPTADMIYSDIRKQYPNISLGTVYRNLALLTELGEIQHLPLRDGADRYDGRMDPHTHFYCRACGKFMDLPPVKTNLLMRAVGGGFDGVIEESMVGFTGLCAECVGTKKGVSG